MNVSVRPVNNAVQILNMYLMPPFTVMPGPCGESQATAIAQTDMVSIPADAYVCPHFNGMINLEGSNKAVESSSRGISAFHEYQQYLRNLPRNSSDQGRAQQNWGDVMVTGGGGSLSSFLLNVVSVGIPGKEAQFDIIQIAVRNVMKTAQEQTQAESRKLNKIVFPPIGVKEEGRLSDALSALAVLSAIETFRIENQQSVFPQMVTIATGADKATYDAWVKILELGPLNHVARSYAERYSPRA